MVLDLRNYATKKEIKDATVADISNLAAKSDFIEVDKLDINKLVNLPTSLDKLKKDLDVGKLKAVPVELKKGMY